MNSTCEREEAENVLGRIGTVLKTVDREAVYGEVLKIVLEATESRFGLLGYINEKGDLVVPSMTKDIWEKCRIADKSAVFRREWWGDSIWVRALKQQETLFSNEPSARTPPGHIPVRRNVAAPIILHGTVLGLLQVANKDSDYETQDLRLLDRIAATLAPFLQTRLQEPQTESAA